MRGYQDINSESPKRDLLFALANAWRNTRVDGIHAHTASCVRKWQLMNPHAATPMPESERLLPDEKLLVASCIIFSSPINSAENERGFTLWAEASRNLMKKRDFVTISRHSLLLLELLVGADNSRVRIDRLAIMIGNYDTAIIRNDLRLLLKKADERFSPTPICRVISLQ